MSTVRLENVDKIHRGGVHALRGLSLDVADGEYVVVVGPSGSGKTTLLRLVAGLDRPTSGTISIGGRDVAGVPPQRRDVAMVFQDAALYPHMTARSNLAFGLRMRKVARDDIGRRVAEAADRLEIRAVLDRRPGELSGGERQRVALGKALLRQPGCLLLDEPLSDLDAPQRRALRKLLAGLHRRSGTTTIHVTHDQEEAMALGNRVAVLAEGRVQQVGAPREIYEQPANRFVAEFIGSPPMNMLPARMLIPDAREDALAGVRPESLRVDGHSADAIVLEATVTLVEPLGDRADVHVETPAGTRLIARVPAGDAPGQGSVTTMTIERSAIHLFESKPFGARIAPTTDPG